jgi:predicted O-linked N-acetylglucosamine transferase (SPINDLY family)
MPTLAAAHSHLGNSLHANRQFDDAVAAYREAIALRPEDAESHFGLGNALREKGHMDQALAAYQRAVAIHPNLPEGHNNIGNAFYEMGRLDEAVAAFGRAITIRPDYPEAFSNLGNTLRDKCELDDALAAYRQAIALKPDFHEAHSNLVYLLHYHPGFDAAAIGREHRQFDHQQAARFSGSIEPFTNDRTAERRLRIGYVSPDLCEHPVGRFLLPLLACHDHARFEIFAYSDVAAPDDLTRQLQGYTDRWQSVLGRSDEQAAQQIRDDQIDILVDLTMHMNCNRMLLFARRPAPVQVTYLAYCSTTGLSAIDYRLSDRYLDPPGGDPSVYSEETVRLADCYWCYQPVYSPDVAPPPAIALGHITFGCLNSFSKVSELTLSIWAKLLRLIPTAELLIHAHQGSHRQRVQAWLEREGIESKRLRFAAKRPLAAYLCIYNEIDIALDTLPYGGGTTTCDALWMGVPTVSMVGKTAVGRGGSTILSNVGLTELVADTQEGYLQIAVTLAQDLPRLETLRRGMRQRMQDSPLMDGPQFANNMEAAYLFMWQRWCKGGDRH